MAQTVELMYERRTTASRRIWPLEYADHVLSNGNVAYTSSIRSEFDYEVVRGGFGGGTMVERSESARPLHCVRPVTHGLRQQRLRRPDSLWVYVSKSRLDLGRRVARLSSLTLSSRGIAFPVLTTAAVELYFFAKIALANGRPPMTPDTGIFLHIGWYLTRGARLYADAWEPKLPLSYETTALLALLSGGDVYLLHMSSVVLMMAAACGVVGVVSALVWDITRDRFAASIAGLSVLLLPGFFVRPAYGYREKYLLLLAGLLAIYLYTHGYPALAGASAAASVGYWQAAIVFPCIVVGMALRNRNWEALARTIAGGLAFTAAMILPVVLVWHSTSEMLVQSVLVPLVTEESTPLVTRLVGGAAHFKWASFLVLLGVVGLGVVAVSVLFDRNDPVGRDEWWILAGAGWFGFFILFVDFETGGYTDLIPILAFLAIGLGVVAARLPRGRPRQYLSGAVAAVLVVNIVLLGSLGLVFSPVETPGPVPMSELQSEERATQVEEVGPVPDIRYTYWNRLEPSTCHYRLSVMEMQWLERTQPYSGKECMDLATARKAIGG